MERQKVISPSIYTITVYDTFTFISCYSYHQWEKITSLIAYFEES